MTDTALEARGLTKTYDNGRIEALRGVDLRVGAGEFLAIQGPSGSGKSTLLHLFGGLPTPSGGEVLYRGTELRAVGSLDQYRARRIGFVFEGFYLMPVLTAHQNVQMPMFECVAGPQERSARASALLSAVGLAHKERSYPSELSAGERQRVAIARSLANDPEILLADEPTGNLDSENAAMVLDMLETIRAQRNMTLVVVTHEREIAARAERVARMRDGRICG